MPDEQFYIYLTDSYEPFNVCAPRPVPYAYRGKLREKLDQMVHDNAIAPVTTPTEWCAPIVLTPKKDSHDIRLCVDLSKLKNYIKRERVTVTTWSSRPYYVKWCYILHHHWCPQQLLAGPSRPWMPRTNYIYHTLWPVYVSLRTSWHLLHFGALQPPHGWGLEWHLEHLQDSGWHHHLWLYIWGTCEARQGGTRMVLPEKDFSQRREVCVRSAQSEVQRLHCGAWWVCCWPIVDKGNLWVPTSDKYHETAFVSWTSQSASLLHWLNLNSHGAYSSPSEDEKSLYVGRQPWPGFWRHQAGP